MVQLLVSDLAADFGRARTKQFVIKDKHGREVRGVDGNLAVLKLYLQVVKLDTAGPIQAGNQLSRPIQAGVPPSTCTPPPPSPPGHRKPAPASRRATEPADPQHDAGSMNWKGSQQDEMLPLSSRYAVLSDDDGMPSPSPSVVADVGALVDGVLPDMHTCNLLDGSNISGEANATDSAVASVTAKQSVGRVRRLKQELEHRGVPKEEIRACLDKADLQALFNKYPVREAVTAETDMPRLNAGELSVKVLQVTSLPKMDMWGKCDPLVELTLDSLAGANAWTTSHRSNTYNADFSNEGPYVFHTHDNSCEFQGGLTARVFDWNRTQARQLVGEAKVLEDELLQLAGSSGLDPDDIVTLEVAKPVCMGGSPRVGHDKAVTQIWLRLEWKWLMPRAATDTSQPRNLLSHPSKASLPRSVVVSVVQVESLPKTDVLGKIDPYVKCRLDGVSRQTRCIENSYDCSFHEDFVFDWAGRQALAFEVWDRDSMSNDELVGTAALSVNAGLIRPHVWLNLADSKGHAVIGRDKKPTRLQVMVAPAGDSGNDDDEAPLTDDDKTELGRVLAGVAGQTWHLGVKPRRAGYFAGQSLSGVCVELVLVGPDQVSRGEMVKSSAVDIKSNDRMGYGMEAHWAEWLRLTVHRRDDVKSLSLLATIKTNPSLLSGRKAESLGVAVVDLSVVLVRTSVAATVRTRMHHGEPIKDNHGKATRIWLDFEVQLPNQLHHSLASTCAMGATKPRQQMVLESLDKLQEECSALLQRQQQAKLVVMRAAPMAAKLRERLVDLQMDAATCAFSDAERHHHQVQVKAAEQALLGVSGQFSGGLQRDILIGMAITIAHVFLFRLFLG